MEEKPILQIQRSFFRIFYFYKNFFIDFWNQYPLLMWAFSFALGSGLALHLHLSLVFFFMIFLYSLPIKKIIIALLLASISFLYTLWSLPTFPVCNIQAQGTFTIESISKCTTFQTSILHKGYFVSDDHKIRCPVMYYSKEKTRLKGNFSYHVDACLQISESHVKMKMDRIFSIEKKHNLVELRYLYKNQFNHFLHQHIQDYWIYTFLSALLTGDMNENLLKYAFGKTGLQHVMAISGSHFILLALFFSFFLNFFFRPNLKNTILIILMNLYFLFVGPTPSVERAYIMIQIALFCEIYQKKYFALQGLGISLILLLIYSPLNLCDLGFQLSYLSTFALLLFFPSFKERFSRERSNNASQQMEMRKKTWPGLKISQESLALMCAVNLLLIPVLLYLFHKFSLFSLVYNLFIPFLVGVLMLICLFILSLDFIIPFLAIVLDPILEFLSKLFLTLIFYPCPLFNWNWTFSHFSFGALMILLGIIFFGLYPYFGKKDASISWPII